ncbi:MAG: hypothetical protein WC604_05100 [Candidatus Gracilibacteria bacterium]
METVPINIFISKGDRLPGDLCHRLEIGGFEEIPPDQIRLFGHRETTQSIEEIRAMIEEAVPGIKVTVSDHR